MPWRARAATPPVLEIYPEGLTLRSALGDANEVAIPSGASTVTLLLNSQSSTSAQHYALELLDAKGQVVWRASGRLRHTTGDYTISLPASFLRAGVYRIGVYAERGTQNTLADEYRLRIR